MPDYFDPRSFGSLEIRQAEQAESIDQKIDYSSDKTQATQLMAIDRLQLKRLDSIKMIWRDGDEGSKGY